MDYTQGEGIIGARSAEGQPIPLTGVSVSARLAGPFLAATMAQRWSNTGSKAVEALWHFPVPQGATVRGLEIEREGRRFVAELDERDAAFDRFDRALEEGKRAALLDAETEGILALRLGNLAPGDSVLVELSWVAVVEEAGDGLRLRLPTAIGPRYFPAGYKDDGDLPLADRLELPWKQKVPYGIAVEIELADPETIAEYSSPSHKLTAEAGASSLRVKVGGGFEALDRDFVLDLRLAEDRPARAWLETGPRGTWAAADLRFPEAQGRGPQAVAFLLDISGSMEGESLAAAQRAIKAALGALGEGDSFGLFAFSNDTKALARKALKATDAQVLKARAWVDALAADGGTELRPALERVYAAGPWTEVLVLTDGDVGNVEEISGLAEDKLAATATRLSLLGIGSAPAGDALAAIARAGGGAMATVHPGDRIETRALALARGMLAGRLEGIGLRSGGVDWELAAPVAASSGQRCRFLARLPRGAAGGSGAAGELGLEVVARSGVKALGLSLASLAIGGEAGKSGALQALWARDRVADTLDRAAWAREGQNRKRLEKAAVALSREAGILSTVVSMVIVDAEGPRVEGRAVQLDVPVLLPAGYGGGAYLEKEDLMAKTMSCPAPRATKKARTLQASKLDLGPSYELMASAMAPDQARLRKESAAAPASGPDIFELLALQLPGGGFGPRKELVALLGLGGAKDALPAFKDPEEERCALAALALAWLELRHAEEASTWEGLVQVSRKRIKDFVAAQAAATGARALADPLAWARGILEGKL